MLQHIQENLQLKADRLRNVTIAGHKLKYIPVYECCGKGIHVFFKEYHDAPPEDEGSIGFTNFHDIVKLLTMRGESKYGLYTYYIEFCHGKNVFDHMLYRIGKMDLDGSSSIYIIGFIKSLKKEWHNNYELLT